MKIDRELIQGPGRKVEAALNWKIRKCWVGGIGVWVVHPTGECSAF